MTSYTIRWKLSLALLSGTTALLKTLVFIDKVWGGLLISCLATKLQSSKNFLQSVSFFLWLLLDKVNFIDMGFFKGIPTKILQNVSIMPTLAQRVIWTWTPNREEKNSFLRVSIDFIPLPTNLLVFGSFYLKYPFCSLYSWPKSVDSLINELVCQGHPV